MEVTWWQKKGPNTKAAHVSGALGRQQRKAGLLALPGQVLPRASSRPRLRSVTRQWGGGRPGLLARGIRGAKRNASLAAYTHFFPPHAQRLSSRHFWVRTGCPLWEPSWRRCHRSSGRCRPGLKALLLRTGCPCVQGRSGGQGRPCGLPASIDGAFRV